LHGVLSLTVVRLVGLGLILLLQHHQLLLLFEQSLQLFLVKLVQELLAQDGHINKVLLLLVYLLLLDLLLLILLLQHHLILCFLGVAKFGCD
jgi:hypothetical protein